ncbi:recombinase family protein [Roseomonas oryzicola]|uniref:Recombinase family protein n=1 Tax=Neoroseomonas oryzicola TaxID=535904 RepID=A0A9X9WJX6_9PROT|nr:recombinase family protein [Neoroseomonas oryzicola]NKE20005.1 recombinase family protein [Neoroseomonas oryzicola]
MRSRRGSVQPAGRTGLRCAIYTRKSSEEGLEQEFNSLDAQREACEAYIRSQRHEGWNLLSARYDDGGLSGGTMNRLGLQSLLADVASGKVDLVVLYKVDRLTRSLSDFAKIVEVLDGHGASFVSVTQQFNTTTSMGRLTLNMLLSFAKFEREVTGERIRDKIAASKRKGMWMGGSVPLGYEVKDRKLVVHSAEAGRVRAIYRAYLVLGTVRLVQQHLAEKGITGKAGRPLARGAVFHLLQNRVYRGEVAHRGNVYPGEHAAIVDTELWEAVQQGLAASRADRRLGGNASHPSLLAGMVADATGEPMVPTHANKGGHRYRCYVSNGLITGTREEHADALRVPAAALERVVFGRIARLLSDGPELLSTLRSARVLPTEAAQQRRVLEAAGKLARRWHQQGHAAQREILLALQAEMTVQRQEITINLAPHGLLAVLAGKGGSAATAIDKRNGNGDDRHLPRVTLTEPVSLRRGGREIALLVGSTVAADRSDPSLVRLIAKAWALREALVSSTAPSLTAVAAEQGISQSYATRLVRLAWLAPDIVEAILGGCQPANLTASRLMQDTRISTDWHDQRRAAGFI